MKQVNLSEHEISMIALAIETSIDYLQNQKGTIFGAMAGLTKIDAICKNLKDLKEKLEREDS